MTKPRTVRAFSAGGVVYRRMAAPGGSAREGERAEVVLVGRAREDFWVLPKGTPLAGETTEQVARREVAEETGVTARIVGEVGSIHYWFSRRGVRYNKEVFYYLMEAVGGDVSLHDHEYDDARWFPLAEAAGHVAYANEEEIVRRAVAMIAGSARP
ncbi:MAG TPA: NUDIX hydrolase [Ktedonobacterales bacterium]|jgi:8-oxo-dGTP pyrophosphatase MutT (NUDIX family)|nr:NUDIX hydrolase [Ktedonobacterales bacterium]